MIFFKFTFTLINFICDFLIQKTELSYETNPNQSQSQVGETVVGNVKSRMAMFEKK